MMTRCAIPERSLLAFIFTASPFGPARHKAPHRRSGGGLLVCVLRGINVLHDHPLALSLSLFLSLCLSLSYLDPKTLDRDSQDDVS